jgi:hypothetical protein
MTLISRGLDERWTLGSFLSNPAEGRGNVGVRQDIENAPQPEGVVLSLRDGVRVRRWLVILLAKRSVDIEAEAKRTPVTSGPTMCDRHGLNHRRRQARTLVTPGTRQTDFARSAISATRSSTSSSVHHQAAEIRAVVAPGF